MEESRLKIEKREENGKTVLALTGKIDSVTATELGQAALPALDENDLALDMAAVTYISSAGLRILTQCYKKANAATRAFTLRNVTDTVNDVLTVSGIVSLLSLE